MTDAPITPFRVEFDATAVDDLRTRLRSTRWPKRETVDDWSQGTPLAFMQDLAAYWCDGYDFDAAATRLNAWPQFTTEIDGLDIHFLHARSPHPDALPLVITHGWPGSVVEFHEGDRAADRPGRPRRRRRRRLPRRLPIAARLRVQRQAGHRRLGRRADRRRPGPTLMRRLGYDRYGAQGGDWGSAVTTSLGAAGRRALRRHPPQHAMGHRRRMSMANRPRRRPRAHTASITAVGVGLFQAAGDPAADPRLRPGRLAGRPGAWMVEKFWAWTDCDGHPRTSSTRDELLDNVMLYWVTRRRGVVGPPLLGERRPRRAARSANAAVLQMGEVTVPTGCSVFPRDPPPASAPGRTTLHQSPLLERAGEGWALRRVEQPEIFVDEVRALFRPLR